MSMLNVLIIASMLLLPMQYVRASEAENTVFINEN